MSWRLGELKVGRVGARCSAVATLPAPTPRLPWLPKQPAASAGREIYSPACPSTASILNAIHLTSFESTLVNAKHASKLHPLVSKLSASVEPTRWRVRTRAQRHVIANQSCRSVVQRQWRLFGRHCAWISKFATDELKLQQRPFPESLAVNHTDNSTVDAVRNHRRCQDATWPILWRSSIITTPEPFDVSAGQQDNGKTGGRLQILAGPGDRVIGQVHGIPHLLIHD